MKKHACFVWLALLMLAVFSGPATVQGALVDLSFSPAMQSVPVGGFVDVQLLADSNDATPLSISALDVILNYDATYLELQSVTNPGGQWFVSDFLPDMDGINMPITDGDALYTALAPGSSLPVTPPTLEVTTFRFVALAETPGTDVIMLATLGASGETRVFGEGAQNNITGDFDSVATIRIVPEPASFILLAAGASSVLLRRRRSAQAG
ncbi:MAG TPA: PEP-CTERM sorting domain-containing protein [Phycisphaerae bacterium]|nr:PEP-CTERM sorting domain-containing protein [Phycisphaerae bacterium]